MKNLVATFSSPSSSNAINYGGKKETVETLRLIAFIAGKLRVVCDARFYMSRRCDGASPVYCSVWIHGAGDVYLSGTGVATGCGYHKTSAALEYALASAGVSLTGDVYGRAYKKEPAHIGGVGSDAMREALLAVAVAAGADVSVHIFN